MRNFGLNRNVPVVAKQTALLVIDVQNYNMENGGEYAGMDADEKERKYGYFFSRNARPCDPQYPKFAGCGAASEN